MRSLIAPCLLPGEPRIIDTFLEAYDFAGKTIIRVWLLALGESEPFQAWVSAKRSSSGISMGR